MKSEKNRAEAAGSGGWKKPEEVIAGVTALGDRSFARTLPRFFKTGPGEYGEGDRFLGVRTPVLRRHLALCGDFPDGGVPFLLASPWHEVRMFGLLLWVDRYRKGGAERREWIFRRYLEHTARVNSWDLVDVSAPAIVGVHVRGKDRSVLYELAASELLWDRRIALVATLALIRHGDFGDALRLADRAAEDREPLMHKAAGWMLREIGKRDRSVLEAFLRPRCGRLPRVLLRYSLEHFPADLRKAYLAGLPPGLPGSGAGPEGDAAAGKGQ